MLVIDFFQPSPDGYPLAIVWFPFQVDGASHCDVALVRLSPIVVAALPNAGADLPNELRRFGEAHNKGFVHAVTRRDPATWKALGLSVVAHRADLSPEQARQAAANLLNHKAWVSAREGMELLSHLSAERTSPPRVRL